MARAVVLVALLALIATAFAQQFVPCTFTQSGQVNSPSTFSRAGVTNCWQLDGLGDSAHLSSGEVATPSSVTLTISNDNTVPSTFDACAATSAGCTKSSIVCVTNNAIYGNVRDLKLTGTITNGDTGSVSARVATGVAAFSSDSGNDFGKLTLRYDGAGTCTGAANGSNPGPFSADFSLTSASGKSLASLGSAIEVTIGTDLATTVVINVYGSSAASVATTSISVQQGTSNNPVNYIVNFSAFTGDQSAFSNTGAIEFVFGDENRDSNIFFIDIIPTASVSVSAFVYTDVGCNGFQNGSGDVVQNGAPVTLTLSGTGSGCTGTTSATTGSAGTFTFANVQSGCTYTVQYTGGQTLCPSNPASVNVAAGGQANFPIAQIVATYTVPPPVTVTCGASTDPSSTGVPTLTTGTSNGNSPTYTDAVNSVSCTAPGATISVITRTWSFNGASFGTQTITVVDSRATPILSGVPTGSTFPCNGSPTVATVTGSGTCTPVTVTNNVVSSANTCDVSTCTLSQTATVTYTGRDQCGNTVTQSALYTATGCGTTCTNPPPPPTITTPPPPPPTQLPTNANCRFICDDDDSSASALFVSALLAALLALVAAF